MADVTFKPYWRPLGEGSGPNSWVFFVLAKLAGHHCPVAVVSSIGGCEEESLHGVPLVTCCRRIVTILSDPANHTAIRGELALASDYYARNDLGEHRREPVELPQLNRRQPEGPDRVRPWDRTMVAQFPFIYASLLQGVALDPLSGRNAPHRPEPLATVYRDTDIEWGMVVFDITDLSAVRYGIVGFAVAMARFIPSIEEERKQLFSGLGFHFLEGPLKVIDEVRPRAAMSASEYMKKFKYPIPDYSNSHHTEDIRRLATIQLVESSALELVWPPDQDNEIPLTLTNPPVNTHISRDLQDQTIRRLIQETYRTSDLEISHLDEVRKLPDFHERLRHNMLEYSGSIGSTRSSGRLIRLAFAQNGHLGLERLKNLSADSISAALDERPDVNDSIRSLSFCINNIRDSTPAQIADALSRTKGLREICLLQSPTHDSKLLSVQLFAELASRTELLSRTNVIFAGAYSAALRKQFWLPTRSSLVPMGIFPVQQIFVRHERSNGRGFVFNYNHVHMEDGLLKPERFAAGFLLWLSTLQSKGEWMFTEAAPCFTFSSAPSSLASDPESSAQVSSILCEDLSLPFSTPNHSISSPKARNLVPGGGWTVLVSQEENRVKGVWNQYRIRFAFIRALRRSILVDDPPSSPLGPDELEVCGLKEFLSATGVEIDPKVVDLRLQNTAHKILAMATADGYPWPADVDPLSVLSHTEAATVLSEFLDNARMQKQELRRAMEEDPKSEPQVSPIRHVNRIPTNVEVYNVVDWSWYLELME
ncbi:hypothetical protein PFICI_14650 [Pestalotiopsis fici W106-1]|uniref:Uncharacterized protein n=1 Tax=Pestalotiopsis fici (strain W106-1 / CGMCC3.15140) TaxID=1229662 RepID=W3WIU9_PESFW|nr:uncharacterized protein PFICI_14650 [Pestalotiopsis fici W106-1]ETS73704.1 hypothetical protein PFICI_14650 [Pestalotiopsis fici W106-1]